MNISYPTQIVQELADTLGIKGDANELCSSIPHENTEVVVRTAMLILVLHHNDVLDKKEEKGEFTDRKTPMKLKDIALSIAIQSVKRNWHFKMSLPLLLECFKGIHKERLDWRYYLRIARGEFGDNKHWRKIMKVLRSALVKEQVVLGDHDVIMNEIPQVAGDYYYVHGWPLHAVWDEENPTYVILRVRCLVWNGSDVDVVDEQVIIPKRKMGVIEREVEDIWTYGSIRCNQMTFRCRNALPCVADGWFYAADKIPAESMAIRTGAKLVEVSDGYFLGELRHEMVENERWKAGVGYWGGLANESKKAGFSFIDVLGQAYIYIEADHRFVNLYGTGAREGFGIVRATPSDFQGLCSRVDYALSFVKGRKDNEFDVSTLNYISKVLVNTDAFASFEKKLDKIDNPTRWNVAWLLTTEQLGASPQQRMRIAKTAGEILVRD